MVRVIFVSDGDENTLDIPDGISVMEGAVRGGIDGIDADCGGQLACATCHVHVDATWLDRLAPPNDDEREMLEHAVGVDERSRLSCQLKTSPALDGLLVHIPPSQH
jgi:2Fe-2S ferredoxin